jgi:hypothetical protein
MVLSPEVCSDTSEERRARSAREAAQEPKDFWEFAGTYFAVMPQGLLGIASFQTLLRTRSELLPYGILALLFLLGLRPRRVRLPSGGSLTLLILVGYVAIHAGYVYRAHLATGAVIAIAGRYWLPVTPLIFGWLGIGLASWPGRARSLLAASWILVSILGGLPWFLMAADASWFGFVPYRTPEAILQLGVFQSQELVVYDSADGRSGDWWCQNHFGGNFGGHRHLRSAIRDLPTKERGHQGGG